MKSGNEKKGTKGPGSKGLENDDRRHQGDNLKDGNAGTEAPRAARNGTRGLGKMYFLPLLSNWHILASIYMVRGGQFRRGVH